MSDEKRFVLDCRMNPEARCTLAISGTEAEVLSAGEQHATSIHGFKWSPGLRNKLKGFLKEEVCAS
jgi:hypothetical protein